MSLGRLLSAAKALTMFNESPTAYRVRPAALLPKFGGPNDPFASKPEGNGDAAAQPGAAPPVAPRTRRSFWSWTLGKGRNGSSAEAKLALPSKARGDGVVRSPVQSELSLDNVRVVRNDLRDSDVDVVARGGGAASGRPPVTANLMLGVGVAEKALDRLADRIVGAGTR